MYLPFYYFYIYPFLNFHHFPCRTAGVRSRCSHHLPRASSSITHLPPSLFPSCAIYCSVPLAPFSQSRRKMNSLGSQAQPHSTDQLREPQSTEFTSPQKPACIGQPALHSFIWSSPTPALRASVATTSAQLKGFNVYSTTQIAHFLTEKSILLYKQIPDMVKHSTKK